MVGLYLLIKEQKVKWKIKYSLTIKSAAPSPEGRGRRRVRA